MLKFYVYLLALQNASSMQDIEPEHFADFDSVATLRHSRQHCRSSYPASRIRSRSLPCKPESNIPRRRQASSDRCVLTSDCQLQLLDDFKLRRLPARCFEIDFRRSVIIPVAVTPSSHAVFPEFLNLCNVPASECSTTWLRLSNPCLRRLASLALAASTARSINSPDIVRYSAITQPCIRRVSQRRLDHVAARTVDCCRMALDPFLRCEALAADHGIGEASGPAVKADGRGRAR